MSDLFSQNWVDQIKREEKKKLSKQKTEPKHVQGRTRIPCQHSPSSQYHNMVYPPVLIYKLKIL